MAKKDTSKETPAKEDFAELLELSAAMNEILGLDPAIDLEEKWTKDDLFKRLQKEAKLIGIDTDSNRLTAATVEADKKAFDGVDEKLWIFMDAEGLLEHTKAVAKGGGRKPAAEKAPKAPKEPAAPRFTRYQAFGELVKGAKGDYTAKDLVKEVDVIYSKNNGNVNEKEAELVVNRCVQLLSVLGIATKTGDKISFKL